MNTSNPLPGNDTGLPERPFSEIRGDALQATLAMFRKIDSAHAAAAQSERETQVDTSNPAQGNDTGLPKPPDLLRHPPLWAKAGQLRHLCRIGLAATDTNAVLDHMSHSFEALFEVMHRLADEIESEVDLMDPAGGGVAR